MVGVPLCELIGPLRRIRDRFPLLPRAKAPAMESWRQDSGKRPLAEYLLENFAALEAEI